MGEADPFGPRGDFLDGRFVLPGRPTGEIPLEDPGDLEGLCGAFPFAAAAVDEAVDVARRSWAAWRDRAAEDRAAPLRRLAEVIRRSRDRLAAVIAREVGKPTWEARTEVDAMVAKVTVTLEEGLALVEERAVDLGSGTGRWRSHARGVLAVLGPFNFPGHLVHGWVVPALACGNTVVVKPSERAAAVGQLYAELVAESGFPPGVFNLIQGDGDQGARLAGHAGIDGVLFTGSWGVGRRILEATLDQPWKLVALEMGGKNGLVVWDDADVDAAVYHAAFGACATTGQRCSSTSRVIVHRSVSDAFTQGLLRILRGLRVGYPLDPDTFMGPLIAADARARHAKLHAWAREEGAECLLEGGPTEGPRPGHYVRPSLHRIDRASRAGRYHGEEHFVPDLCLLEVDGIHEAVEALNAVDYGLVASVFSRERKTFETFRRQSRVGLIHWNTGTVGASGRLPFGGIGRSGNDHPAGILAAAACTYPVASIETPSPSIPSPPPGFPWPI